MRAGHNLTPSSARPEMKRRAKVRAKNRKKRPKKMRLDEFQFWRPYWQATKKTGRVGPPGAARPPHPPKSRPPPLVTRGPAPVTTLISESESDERFCDLRGLLSARILYNL